MRAKDVVAELEPGDSFGELPNTEEMWISG